MVPAIGARAVGLDASVFDGDTAPDVVLHHGNSVQPSDVLSLRGSFSLFYDVSGRVHETKGLACISHALVLAFEVTLVLCALLSLVDLPCAVDSPVSEVAIAGESEWSGCEGMRQEVADQFFSKIVSTGLWRICEQIDSRMRASFLGPPRFLFCGTGVLENDLDCWTARRMVLGWDVAGEAVICGAALRRQRREKRLFMTAGVCCEPAERIRMCRFTGRGRQGDWKANGQGWYRQCNGRLDI